ncbi:MAG: hypothetical protein HY593_00765 [Candidatus Omnitrophica bacterium]|nr:hypothetical protein [Candidatus Omnitrophota bacterium]
MAKLLERLVSVEKKVDTVIAQTAGKSSMSGEPAKPFQSSQAKQPPRRDRTLYEAVCADCHKVCEVPFRPSEGRAVYCKECFMKRKSGGQGKNLPVLTPVVLPPKPVSKPIFAPIPPPLPQSPVKKTKKSQPVKKAKKAKSPLPPFK